MTSFRSSASVVAVFCGIGLLILGLAPVWAQTPGASQLTVEVSGLRNFKGQVVIYLWRDSKDVWQYPDPAGVQHRDERMTDDICDFPRASVCRRIVISLQNLTVAYTFQGLAEGDYAVMAVHDENNNGLLDTGFLGRPLEGRGFSQILPQDIGMLRTSVSFRKTRFTVSGAKTITVGLKYPPRVL